MTFLLAEMLPYILLVFAIGFVVGWYARPAA
jgi:hypothetical protein